mmetsp:Transcript_18020/g.36957  ORF Transcript_18020/g.36957 Transcript_18020/m.36957 type:complete len:247 (+) Transcript_18020:827-1567(+)
MSSTRSSVMTGGDFHTTRQSMCGSSRPSGRAWKHLLKPPRAAAQHATLEEWLWFGSRSRRHSFKSFTATLSFEAAAPDDHPAAVPAALAVAVAVAPPKRSLRNSPAWTNRCSSSFPLIHASPVTPSKASTPSSSRSNAELSSCSAPPAEDDDDDDDEESSARARHLAQCSATEGSSDTLSTLEPHKSFKRRTSLAPTMHHSRLSTVTGLLASTSFCTDARTFTYGRSSRLMSRSTMVKLANRAWCS